MKFLRAFIGPILLFYVTSVSGWAGFKNLPPEKRAQLKRIAVAQGLHVDKHVQEMMSVPVRAKRSTCSGYGGSSSGGGGGSSSSGRGGGRGGGRGSLGGRGGGGGGGGVTQIETIVVTGQRIPSSSGNLGGLGLGWGSIGRGGGGGGGGPPPPPPQPQEPPEDPQAKKMTYQHFVHALQQLEAMFPNLPPNEMANKLRMLVGRYNSALWKVMLNVNNPIPGVGQDISQFDTSRNPQTFQKLTQMMDHRMQNGAELGVIKINGETVAFGHVMTGVAAGYNQQSVFGMNNLFATTISGDLGQSGLANMQDASKPIIGPAGTWQNGRYMLQGEAGFATNAEILGDIDGFNIGKRIQANPQKSLSQHFNEYYSGGESSQRFSTFTGHTTKGELTTEVYRFANLYQYKNDGLLSSILQNSSADLAVRRATQINDASNRAVAAFCSRYSSQLGSWC